MKLVYVLGGNYDASGMCSVITKKINWLAEHTDWEITALLTESPNGREFYFPLHPSVKIVNFELNYDELDTMPKWRKLIHYRRKQRLYKKAFTDFLMENRPDLVVSAMRREINFLTDIKDGSKKIGELHFCRKIYRVFTHRMLPGFVCRAITSYWQSQLLNKIKRLDAFVVLTEEDACAWGDLPNIHVIPNFIERLPTQTSSCSSKNILAVGRYTWQKGFDMLFKAWKKIEDKHPDWNLVVYGSGDRTYYQNLAKSMDLKHVELNGATKDIADVYQRSSFLAFSSRYEGLSMVLIEAMSYGLPVVSFTCPCGPRDVVHDSENGYLVENFDITRFAERMEQMMGDASRRKAMGDQARQETKKLQKEEIMLKWKCLFDKVCGRG